MYFPTIIAKYSYIYNKKIVKNVNLKGKQLGFGLSKVITMPVATLQ